MQAGADLVVEIWSICLHRPGPLTSTVARCCDLAENSPMAQWVSDGPKSWHSDERLWIVVGSGLCHVRRITAK